MTAAQIGIEEAKQRFVLAKEWACGKGKAFAADPADSPSSLLRHRASRPPEIGSSSWVERWLGLGEFWERVKACAAPHEGS